MFEKYTSPITRTEPDTQRQNRGLNDAQKNIIFGTWQRIEIPSQTVTYFEDGTAEVRYNNKLVSKFNWDISGSESDIRGSVITETESGRKRTYEIKELDESSLLLYYPYAKKNLSYRRIK